MTSRPARAARHATPRGSPLAYSTKLGASWVETRDGTEGWSMTTLEQLPTLNTMSPEYQADWHGLNRAALAQSPVAQGVFGPVLLGYREVQTVIRDRSFRNPPALALEVQGITEGELYDRTVSGILSLDGEEHTRLRRL